MRCSGRKLLIWISLMLLLILVGHFLSTHEFRLPALKISNNDVLMVKSSPNAEEDIQTRKSTFTAGMYMAGRQPRNKSCCKWYHGLPKILSYPAFKVTWGPETGERSPYRVLPFVLRGTEEKKELPQVTLCTHATADQVYGIVELARRWEGPLSLAVFTPGYDAGIAVALLDHACRCEPEMYKVSAHLIFPVGRPPALSHIAQVPNDCAALNFQRGKTERNQEHMSYPINVARNVARMQANTMRVLVIDIELLPSEKLASSFMQIVHGRQPKAGVVFVVPVFEIESYELPPSTKKELLLATKAGVAVYFHRYLCPHCQKFPGLTRWLMKPDPGKVKPFIITKREYPHHRWEPIFIGTQNDPLYAEEMSWEGKQDKMSQMFEMCLLNYRLIILDGAFLVHTPGIKRKNTKPDATKQEFLKLHEKRNSRIYQRIIKHLLKQYPNNHKCMK